MTFLAIDALALIPIVSIVLAAMTFVGTQWSLSRTARKDMLAALQTELTAAEAKLKQCKEDCRIKDMRIEELNATELRLMREIIQIKSERQ